MIVPCVLTACLPACLPACLHVLLLLPLQDFLQRTTLCSAIGERLRLVTHYFAPQHAESLYGIAPKGILVELQPAAHTAAAQRIPDTRLCRLDSSCLAN